MRPELPLILRAYASDLGIAGPQYATMAAVLREAANALEESDSPVPAAVPNSVCSVDGDFIPGVRCTGFGCED